MTRIFWVPTSPGDLIDRITILEIKARRLSRQTQLRNVERELSLLKQIFDEQICHSVKLSDATERLRQLNLTLWELENRIRDCERPGSSESDFAHLARQIYLTNDERSIVKREINELLGSEIIEEKLYSQ